jgi:integrase
VGSIINRDGKWRAQVRRKGHAPQCKTFSTKTQAALWVRQREADIDGGVVLPQLGELTIGQVIDAYRALRDETRPISDSSNEHYMLKALQRGLGEKRVATIGPADLVAYATSRRDDGAGPYTINMDVSKLGTVLRYGGAALKVAMPDLVGSARPLLAHLRLIGGGGKRERRPQEDELRRILAYLTERRGLVYAESVAFAAITAMRRGEVCAALKTDIDLGNRVLAVWRKHPRKGKTLERVPLLGEAWTIAMRQPESEDGRLFPIEPGTLSKYFTEACRGLAIPDLHLHDMRHEGTSRLFEEGYEIRQVALVTAHKDWRNLKRYKNLRPEDLHAALPASRSRQDAAPARASPKSKPRSPLG